MTYEAENFNKLASSSQHNFNSLEPISMCENSQWPTAGSWGVIEMPPCAEKETGPEDEPYPAPFTLSSSKCLPFP